MPVVLTFSRYQPFCAAVIAGKFTGNAVHQSESKGFAVLHIPYDSILAAFGDQAGRANPPSPSIIMDAHCGASSGITCRPCRRYRRKCVSRVKTWQSECSSESRTRQASASDIGVSW